MSIFNIMADEDSEIVYVDMDIGDIVTPSMDTWLLLAGSLHHATGTLSQLYFRKKSTAKVFWSFVVLAATATQRVQVEIAGGWPLLNVRDEIYFGAGAGSQGCNLKLLQFIPKKVFKIETSKGFWKYL